MAYKSAMNTSVFGNRLGLQQLSTNQSGTGLAGRQPEFIVGPEDIRKETTTGDSTSTYMKAYGISLLSSGNTAASGAVMRLDPPIPGVAKTIVILSTAAGVASTIQWNITASTGGAEVFRSTWSTSFTVLQTSSPVVINLLGVTTSIWALQNSSAAFGAATTTT